MPDTANDQKYESGPLTEMERRLLRKLIDEDQKRRWATKALLQIATWLTGIILAATVGIDALKKILKGLAP